MGGYVDGDGGIDSDAELFGGALVGARRSSCGITLCRTFLHWCLGELHVFRDNGPRIVWKGGRQASVINASLMSDMFCLQLLVCRVLMLTGQADPEHQLTVTPERQQLLSHKRENSPNADLRRDADGAASPLLPQRLESGVHVVRVSQRRD